jgi:hypothetical protein
MEINEFTTNDLSLTAYLVMRGCTLIDARQMGKSYKFTLDLGNSNKHKMQADYINSESRKFDAAVRDLKKIMFGGN